MKYFFGIVALVLSLGKLNAQSLTVDPSIKTSREVMDDFMNQRFGIFIHRGPAGDRNATIFDYSWRE